MNQAIARRLLHRLVNHLLDLIYKMKCILVFGVFLGQLLCEAEGDRFHVSSGRYLPPWHSKHTRTTKDIKVIRPTADCIALFSIT